MNNKKGFTLVELLGVIVILGFITSIAVLAISRMLDTSKTNMMRETAISIISGVKQRLTMVNKIENGDYQFTGKLLESGGIESPLGGTLQYLTDINNCNSNNIIGDTVCKVSTQTCSASTTSFVRVTRTAGVGSAYSYSICLTAGSGHKYINLATETALLDGNNSSTIIKG